MSEEPATNWTATWLECGKHIDLGSDSVFVIDSAARSNAADGPPVLLLHGFPSSSLDYALIFDGLNAHRRVVALDLLGYGFSDKPDREYSLFAQADLTESILERLGVTSVDLVTHDMGNSVGGELLARDSGGERVSRRVLLNGSIYMDLARLTDEQQLLRSLGDCSLPTGLAPDSETIHTSLGRTLSESFLPDPDIDALLRAIADCVVRAEGNHRLPRLIRYVEERLEHERRWTGAIEQHPAPLTILWGDEDPIAVADMALRLAAKRPDAALHLLRGVGHYPAIEDPQATQRAILAAFERD